MAEGFYKNSGAAVRFFKNPSRGRRKSAELKPAGSAGSHTGPFTDISCAADAAGSSLSEQKEHDGTASAKAPRFSPNEATFEPRSRRPGLFNEDRGIKSHPFPERKNQNPAAAPWFLTC